MSINLIAEPGHTAIVRGDLAGANVFGAVAHPLDDDVDTGTSILPEVAMAFDGRRRASKGV